MARSFGSTPATQSAGDWLDQFANFEKTGVPAQTEEVKGVEKFDLGRMKALLEAMGRPQDAYPVVHIAGSKGKGSVATMVTSILRAAGLKVGLYTSPHITSIHERIDCGTPISEEALQQLVEGHKGAVEAQAASTGISHFEVLTALAYRHFADEGVDIAVVETGLGGTYDATNVFDSTPPERHVAVITHIGLEHTAVLGGTTPEIAAAKAGILRPGGCLVLGPQRDGDADEALRAASSAAAARLVDVDRAIDAAAGPVGLTPEGQWAAPLRLGWDLGEGQTGSVETSLRLLGSHQVQNAATAAAVAVELRQRDLGFRISDADVAAGLASAQLPGRFQVLQVDAGASRAGGGGARWAVLDGAHTDASAAALVTTLQDVLPDKPVALIIAMADDKDHAAVCSALRGLPAKAVIFTTVDIAGGGARSVAPGTLAGHWQLAGMKSRSRNRVRELVQGSMQAALGRAREELTAFPGDGVIVVTGSLHAAAAALRLLRPHAENRP